MHLFVALLRGINVSGHNIIKMSDLITSLSTLGYQNLQTYIQSGNVIFESENNDHRQLKHQIEKQIENDFGYTVTVMVFSKEYFLNVFQNNPLLKYDDIDPKKLYVAFLNKTVNHELLNDLIQNYPEKIILVDKIIYLYYTNGYGKSKANNYFFERKLKVVATTRNWNTIINLNRILTE